jgi:hypothetical protein
VSNKDQARDVGVWTDAEQDRIDAAANKAYNAARLVVGTDRANVLGPVVDEARMRVFEARLAALMVTVRDLRIKPLHSPHFTASAPRDVDLREATLRELESYWDEVTKDIKT